MNKVLDASIRNDFLLTPSDDADGAASDQASHWRWTGGTSQLSLCWCSSVSALLTMLRHRVGACTSVAVTPVTTGDVVAEQKQLLAGVSVSFATNFGEKGMVKRWHFLSGVRAAVADVLSEPEQGSVHLLTGVHKIR